MQQTFRKRGGDGTVPSRLELPQPASPKVKKSTIRASLRRNNRSQILLCVFLVCTILMYILYGLSYIEDGKPEAPVALEGPEAPSSVAVEDDSGKAKSESTDQGKRPMGGPTPEGQRKLIEAKTHVRKDLSELIPKLQEMKKKYPVFERGKHSKKSMFKPYNKENRVQLDQKFDKKTGKLVYDPITSIKKTDLLDMGFKQKELDEVEGVTYEEAAKGREPLVNILNEAGIEDIDPEAIALLPKWSSITKLYGDKPVILGLEYCEDFMNEFDPEDASIGTAGMFNTGTNPLSMYMSNNIKLPRNKKDKAGGTRWQVPWGKHMLNVYKWNNTCNHDEKVNKTNVMPIVAVRDPFTWMQSMCKNPYQARWQHSRDLCPHLAKRQLKEDGTPDKVSCDVVYSREKNWVVHFDSLADYWAEWYKEYLEADYPRLIVRFEDLQFRARELVETIGACAGAVPREKDALFRYVTAQAKWGAAHVKTKTNMLSAMIKYGTDKNRYNGFKENDWLVAKEVLTPYMDLFGYEIPEQMK